jgi:hypothetical protein
MSFGMLCPLRRPKGEQVARFEPDTTADVKRRIGISAIEGDWTDNRPSCPDILEFTDGQIGVIGIDVTAEYEGRLPEGFGVGENERLVVIPRGMLIAAKPDIPDA